MKRKLTREDELKIKEGSINKNRTSLTEMETENEQPFIDKKTHNKYRKWHTKFGII
jgi:hypothetical protein